MENQLIFVFEKSHSKQALTELLLLLLLLLLLQLLLLLNGISCRSGGGGSSQKKRKNLLAATGPCEQTVYWLSQLVSRPRVSPFASF